jgi:hypothetical protein
MAQTPRYPRISPKVVVGLGREGLKLVDRLEKKPSSSPPGLDLNGDETSDLSL